MLSILFYQLFGCWKINFGALWYWDSLTDLVCALSYLKPQNKVGFQNLTWSISFKALPYCATLSYSKSSVYPVNFAFAETFY